MVPAVAVQLQRERVSLPAALGMFSPWSDLGGFVGDTGITLLGVDPLLTPNPSVLAGAAYVGGDTSKFADPLVCRGRLCGPLSKRHAAAHADSGRAA